MAILSNINGKFVVEQTTGYVGVGTTDPNYPIEVLNASAEIALNASGASIYRLKSDSTDYFRINKNGVGDRLVISGGGDVGIGTSTPQKKLHIEGPGGASASQLLVTGASDTVGSTAGILLRAEGGESDSALRAKGGIFFEREAGSFGTGKMHLAVNGAQSNVSVTLTEAALTIDDDRNVGIGTTSPTEKLQIVQGGQAMIGDYFMLGSGNANYMGVLGFNRNTTNGVIYNSSYGAFQIHNNNGTLCLQGYAAGGGNEFEHLFFNNGNVFFDGNVGIGTTSPGRGLTIDKSNANAALEIIKNNTTNQIVYLGTGSSAGTDDPILQMKHNGTENIRLYSTGSSWLLGGNVGIGTATPEHKLVAIGTIGFGLNYNGGVYVNNTAEYVDENWGLEVQRTANVDDYNTRLKYYPATGQSRAAGIYDAKNSRFSLYSDTNDNPNIIIPNGNVGIGTTLPSYKLSVSTTLSSGSHLNANFSDLNSPTAAFVGQGGNVYDSGGIYRSTSIIAPSSGPLTSLFLSTYSSGHWGQQPTFKLVMNGTYYRGGYIEYWCQGIPSGSVKNVIAGPYGTMSDTLSVTITTLCNTCNGGQPIHRQDWSFTTQGAYLRVSPVIITNKVGRRYFNNSSFSALNSLQSGTSSIAGAYFFHSISATQAAGSSNVYTIT